MRFLFHLFFALLLAFFQHPSVSAGQDETKPRFIILFIGDGMGQEQCRAAEAALKRRLTLTKLPVNGTTDTHNVDGKITDSAAAGTALACGARTKNGMLGLTPSGAELESVAVKAKKAGMKVGIITSVPLDHATPAAFYARSNSRDNYADIVRQLAESGFDFFAGEPFLATARGDTEALARIKERGYRLLDNPAVIEDKYEGKICICKKFRRTVDRDEKNNFSLARLTAAAMRSLEGEEGFFIMVEGGAIDWACHQNDGALAVREIEEFDFAVREALDFMAGRPGQGLVIVTADHETGGLAVVDAGKAPELMRQKGSGEKFKELIAPIVKKNAGWQEYLEAVKEFFGMENLTADEEKALRRAWEERSAGKGKRPADEALRLFNLRSGLKWSGTGHTDAPVRTAASGAGADAFAGNFDNSEVALKLLKLLPAGGK